MPFHLSKKKKKKTLEHQRQRKKNPVDVFVRRHHFFFLLVASRRRRRRMPARRRRLLAYISFFFSRLVCVTFSPKTGKNRAWTETLKSICVKVFSLSRKKQSSSDRTKNNDGQKSADELEPNPNVVRCGREVRNTLLALLLFLFLFSLSLFLSLSLCTL